eukprot:g3798.t1
MTEGVWRVPGSVRSVQKYKTQWDHGAVPTMNDETSPFDICSLIKLFFKELPGSLIPASARRGLIDASYVKDRSERVDALKRALKVMPEENTKCLEQAIYHFHLVNANAAKTRMTAKSLAMCFLPRMAHTIEVLVQNYKEVFGNIFGSNVGETRDRKTASTADEKEKGADEEVSSDADEGARRHVEVGDNNDTKMESERVKNDGAKTLEPIVPRRPSVDILKRNCVFQDQNEGDVETRDNSTSSAAARKEAEEEGLSAKDDDAPSSEKSIAPSSSVPLDRVEIAPFPLATRGAIDSEDDRGDRVAGSIDAKYFNLRSKKYCSSRKSRVKVPSLESMYDFVSMHTFASGNRTFVGLVEKGRLSLPSPPSALKRRCEKVGVKYYIVLYIRAAAKGVTTFRKVPSQLMNVVWVFRIRTSFLDALEGRAPCSNAQKLTQQWYRSFERDIKLKNRLKAVCVADNYEVLGLSKMFKGYNGKPCILSRSTSLFRRSDHLEIYVDVLLFRKMPQIMLQKIMKKIPQLHIRMCFTIQGEDESELPEQALCALSFQHAATTVEGGCRYVEDDKDIKLLGSDAAAAASGKGQERAMKAGIDL